MAVNPKAPNPKGPEARIPENPNAPFLEALSAGFKPQAPEPKPP